MATNQQNEERMWTLAIFQALTTWTDKFYRPFLCGQTTPPIDSEWFDYFQKDWKVGRTIKASKKDVVLKYFQTTFRQALNRNSSPERIDQAADHFQKRKWGSKTKTNSKGSRPISIISKVGFFLRPGILVPRDKYALEGLKSHGYQVGANYVEYLAVFNAAFDKFLPAVNSALALPWVSSLAKSLGCPKDQLNSPAFKRKVFDNYLMHRGGYKNKLAEDTTQD